MVTYLEIGGISISVRIDNRLGLSLPRNYERFIVSGDGRAVSASIDVDDCVSDSPAGFRQVAFGFNDLGESRLFFDGVSYLVGISPCPGEEMRFMSFSSDFSHAHLSLRRGSGRNLTLIDSMLRIFFSQTAVNQSSFLIHAASVVSVNGAHLFMGKSGAGKSTHAALWLKNFSDCMLLNDDNPLVRLDADGNVTAHGTPWSGKTKCWLKRSAPLLSMSRICRADRNSYIGLSDVDAFVTALPGVSVISHSSRLRGLVCDTLGRVVGRTKVGILECLSDDDAARLCRQNVETINKSIIGEF